MTPVVANTDQYEHFLRVFTRDRERLSNYIRSLLPNRADAEDVFQQCSILLWQKFDQYDDSREFLPWACGVAFYEVRNFLRVSSRDRLQFDDDVIRQLADRRLATMRQSDMRIQVLGECLENLKESDRELMRAAYDDAQPLADFAEMSGRALQTLYNRLSKLKRLLIECVDRKLVSEGGSA